MVMPGEDGRAVKAVADPGYRFVSWSDGLRSALRTDRNVTADLAVTFTVEGGLVFVPAFPATRDAQWSFLTKPIPAATDTEGYARVVPISYAVGESIDVRFGLVDDCGVPVKDAAAEVRLYRLDSSGAGPLFAVVDVPYDAVAGAYIATIPTVGGDLALLPGAYEWVLTAGDEILERLRIELQ